MNGRLRLGALAFAAAAFVAAPAFTATDVAAQDASGRFRVLIPDFFPEEGADRGFGEDAADELRDMMRSLATHTAIERDEIRDQLRRFEMDMRELDCLRTRQLGAQMNAQVALCATYTDVGGNQMEVDVEFWALESGTSFSIDPFTMDRGDRDETAERILEEFNAYNETLSVRTYCFTYAQEDAFEDAMRNCTQALEMNPSDTQVRKQVARIHLEQAESGSGENVTYDEDLLQQAFDHIERVVEDDPIDDEALQLAGFIASRLDETDLGREYYSRYLELNPGDVAIRRNIAYQLHQADDPEGAMRFVKQGLEIEESADLWVDVGNYAFAAAAQAQDEAASENGGGIGPNVAALYEEAVTAYMNAFEEKGTEMAASALRNVINAQIQLDRPDEAIQLAERILEVHPDEARLWWAYGTALQRAGRTDDAIQALSRVEEIDPDYPNLYAIQGRWLLDQDRLDDAVRLMQQAVERGNDPSRMATLIFATAYPIGNQEENYPKAIRYIEAAKQFQVDETTQEELDFWHGYFLLQQGRVQQEPRTVESARATLPMFQQALNLLQGASGYGDRRPSINVNDFLGVVNQFIEIQEAIIQRAGGQ